MKIRKAIFGSNGAFNFNYVDILATAYSKALDEIWLKINTEGSEYEIIQHLHNQDVIEWIDRLYCQWHARKVPSVADRDRRALVRHEGDLAVRVGRIDRPNLGRGFLRPGRQANAARVGGDALERRGVFLRDLHVGEAMLHGRLDAGGLGVVVPGHAEDRVQFDARQAQIAWWWWRRSAR